MNKYEQAMTDAKKAVDSTVFDSLLSTGASLIGIATILSFVGGALALLESFNAATFKLLILIAIVTGFFSFIFFEYRRLLKVKSSLIEVLATDKTYDLLIADVRKERDEIRSKLTELESQNAMLVMYSTVLKEIKNEISKIQQGELHNE